MSEGKKEMVVSGKSVGKQNPTAAAQPQASVVTKLLGADNKKKGK